MIKIKTYNQIAKEGLDALPHDKYEVSSETHNPDAIILRSHKLQVEEIPSSVLAIGRAGAGVNNIPLAEATARGIPVFNAPGANANAVKELVIGSLLLTARHLAEAYQYTQQLTGNAAEFKTKVEQGKKQFKGFELPGKTVGVIGLGAIGVKVANALTGLGLKVIGFDPTIQVARAWELQSNVQPANSLDELLQKSDIISVHVPLNQHTENLIDAKRLVQMKSDAIVLNFSRGEICDSAAILNALENNQLGQYVCDFPSPELIANNKVITLPHLGASTNEAETLCSVMVCDQIKDFIEHGIIRNAVNIPELIVGPTHGGNQRLMIFNDNVPNMVAKITGLLGENKVNIIDLVNKSKDSIAVTCIDVDQAISDSVLEALKQQEGILSVRAL